MDRWNCFYFPAIFKTSLKIEGGFFRIWQLGTSHQRRIISILRHGEVWSMLQHNNNIIMSGFCFLFVFVFSFGVSQYKFFSILCEPTVDFHHANISPVNVRQWEKKNPFHRDISQGGAVISNSDCVLLFTSGYFSLNKTFKLSWPPTLKVIQGKYFL